MLLLKLIIILIPAALIGYDLYKVPGVFAAIAIVNVVTGVAFHWFGWKTCSAKAKQQQLTQRRNFAMQLPPPLREQIESVVEGISGTALQAAYRELIRAVSPR